jgi:hypothetical protein
MHLFRRKYPQPLTLDDDLSLLVICESLSSLSSSSNPGDTDFDIDGQRMHQWNQTYRALTALLGMMFVAVTMSSAHPAIILRTTNSRMAASQQQQLQYSSHSEIILPSLMKLEASTTTTTTTKKLKRIGRKLKVSQNQLDEWFDQAIGLAGQMEQSSFKAKMTPQKARRYANLAVNLPPNATICETDFSGGISAHLWLYFTTFTTPSSPASTTGTNPPPPLTGGAVLHSFDSVVEERYADVLEQRFGTHRFHLHRSLTQEQLPLFHVTQNCDLVSINAASHYDRNGWDPYHDLMAILPRSKCNATVIFGDAFLMGSSMEPTPLDHRHPKPSSSSVFSQCSQSYWRAVHENMIEHVKCHAFGKREEWGVWPQGYCEAIVLGGGCTSS